MDYPTIMRRLLEDCEPLPLGLHLGEIHNLIEVASKNQEHQRSIYVTSSSDRKEEKRNQDGWLSHVDRRMDKHV